MKTLNVRRVLLTSLVIITCLILMFFVSRQSPLTQEGSVFNLLAPPFVNVARAEANGVSALSFLDDEAGIAAYFKSPTTINLNNVASLFRTIETQTSTYIIGSIAVPNYPETEDVHVYIHVDGWVLAYYLQADPSGKIFDWKAYTGGTNIPTKLENVLGIVATQIGAPSPTPTYYNFRYPNATHLMLIAEKVVDNTDSFQVNLPGSFGYYERSWSIYDSGYTVDGVYITYGCGTHQGTLTAAQLAPDTFHTIDGDQYSCSGYRSIGLALIYRVP